MDAGLLGEAAQFALDTGSVPFPAWNLVAFRFGEKNLLRDQGVELPVRLSSQIIYMIIRIYI